MVKRPNGIEHKKPAFNYRVGDTSLRIYLKMMKTMLPEDQFNLLEPWFPLKDIEEQFEAFRELIVSLVK